MLEAAEKAGETGAEGTGPGDDGQPEASGRTAASVDDAKDGAGDTDDDMAPKKGEKKK